MCSAGIRRLMFTQTLFLMNTTTSSPSKLAVVQQMYQQFAQGNIPALMNALTDDIEWILWGPDAIPYAGTYKGKEAVGNFFQQLAASVNISHLAPRHFIVGENEVVVLGNEGGSALSTGKAFEAEWAHVFFFRGEQVCKFCEYTDTAALAAAF